MTTIKINIFDNILTQVTKKKPSHEKKTLHWRKSQDMNFYQGRKIKIYIKLTRRLKTCWSDKREQKSPQDCWERKQLVHMLLHSNDFQKCTFYIKWEWLGIRRSVSLYVACSWFSLLIFHSILRPFLEICNAESLIAPVAGAYIVLKYLL